MSIFLGILFIVHKNPKLVCYYPVNDPKMSLDRLDSYEKSEVDFIEIGLKTNNPFLDCILIKSDSAFLLTVPLDVENIIFKFSQEVLSLGKGKTAVIFSFFVKGKIPTIGLPLAFGANSGNLKTFI